jgi:hypothetical protein
LAELFRSFLDNDNYIQLAPFRNSVIHHFNHRSTKKLQFDDLNPDYSDSKKLVWKFKSFVYGSPARNGKNEFIRGDLEPAVFVYRFIDSLTEQILPFLEHLIAAEKFRRKNYDSVNFKPTNPVLPEEILYYFIEDSFDLAFKKEYSRELERYKQQLGVLKRKFQSAKYQLYALGLVELQAPYSSRRPMVGRRGVIPVINRFIHGARPALSQIGESLRCWASFTTGSNQ